MWLVSFLILNYSILGERFSAEPRKLRQVEELEDLQRWHFYVDGKEVQHVYTVLYIVHDSYDDYH